MVDRYGDFVETYLSGVFATEELGSTMKSMTAKPGFWWSAASSPPETSVGRQMDLILMAEIVPAQLACRERPIYLPQSSARRPYAHFKTVAARQRVFRIYPIGTHSYPALFARRAAAGKMEIGPNAGGKPWPT